jgi:hypothetical protein
MGGCAFLQRTIIARQIAAIREKTAGWTKWPTAGSKFATS